jgi:hypothetical protein
MRNLKKIGLSIAVISALGLGFSGCGSSGGGSNPPPEDPPSGETQTGKVADGYLDKAKVCLDKNTNGKCDSDEPNTLSTDGSYSLNVDKADKGKYPIIVEVLTTTKDLDDGNFIANAYTLSAPKDSTGFISPITTLIKNEMDKYPVLTKVDATQRISKKLNLTSTDTKLLSDYVANDSDGESKKIHEVGKVVAKLQGALEVKLTQDTVMTNDNKKASVSLILDNIYKDIATTSAQINSGTLASAIDTTTKVANTVVSAEDITTTSNLLSLTKTAVSAIPKDLMVSDMFMFDDYSNSKLRYQKLDIANNRMLEASAPLNKTTDYVKSNASNGEDVSISADGHVIITAIGDSEQDYIDDYGHNYNVKFDMNALVTLDLSQKSYTLKEILKVYQKFSTNVGTNTLFTDLTTVFPNIATKYDTTMNFTSDDKIILMKTYDTASADGYPKTTKFSTTVFLNKSAMDKILNVLQN